MEDLDITREEAKRLGEALKQKEFQKLLKEYYEEVNDPENKKKYQKEVIQFEKERGYDVTFINPDPGYVIKTSVNGDKKAFINICKCDKLEKPVSIPGDRSGAEGRDWSIPYSLLKPREDLDKSGKRCMVYDVVFHPESHLLASNNVHFRNVLNTTALDAVENNLNVKLDRQNLIFPKLGYKGAPVPSIIRKKSETPPDNLGSDFDWSTFGPPINSWFSQNRNENCERKCSVNSSDSDSDNVYAVPKYLIKHRSPIDIQNYTNDRFAPSSVSLPKELVVEINLPLLNSTENVVLDVMEKSVSLLCEKPAKYKLDLILPYTVNEDAGSAKFDKTTRTLTLVLPLKYRHYSSRECDDSGVESDLGTRTPELSSGDDDSIECCRITNKLEEAQSETLDDSELSRKNVSFLDPNKHYTLPPFNCDINDSVVMFTLHVKNVDPTSVAHIFIFDSVSSCYAVHIQFISMGSGYFPLHYAFFVKLSFDIKISEESLLIEALDNYVTITFQIDDYNNTFTDYYYVGVNEDNLEKRVLLSTEVPDNMQEFKNMPFINSFIGSTLGRENEEENNSEVPRALPSLKQRALTRTLSESSGDEFSSSLRKGILKRTSRSMSESSVDDFFCSSSFEMISEEDDGNRNKKSVRFNDVISQKVYRTNSSILGQRKKNQRKIRNKKKALENRRASESETSDWDEKEDKDKGDENGNKKENDTTEESVQDSLDLDESSFTERILLSPDVKSVAGDREKSKVDVITDMMFDLDM